MPEEQPTLTPLQKAQLAAEAVEGTWYFDEYLYRGEPNLGNMHPRRLRPPRKRKNHHEKNPVTHNQ